MEIVEGLVPNLSDPITCFSPIVWEESVSYFMLVLVDKVYNNQII